MSRVNIKRFYNLYEIIKDDLFQTGIEGTESRKSKCKSIVKADKFGGNILEATMVPDLIRGKKYAIRGANIVKWLQKNGKRG